MLHPQKELSTTIHHKAHIYKQLNVLYVVGCNDNSSSTCTLEDIQYTEILKTFN